MNLEIPEKEATRDGTYRTYHQETDGLCSRPNPICRRNKVSPSQCMYGNSHSDPMSGIVNSPFGYILFGILGLGCAKGKLKKTICDFCLPHGQCDSIPGITFPLRGDG